ncbi:Bifunctional lysine-specific demethylase and histidyl-hydroxylase NO66 [Frankliniella fusca]|uniref:Bifunctional lysine-specific demethylase and histidyl-hydroxylase NO66 n=1 Tax=Frankliniella fusca TaxID=407009 RepID=A0AAE1HRX5_9NEOP|nr:Bifunctional lysine-specific demethylase and histidyl-hydroxylase NO66 [Frankliniella fusca]
MPGVLRSVLDNYEYLMNTVSPVSNIVQCRLWKNHIQPRYAGKTVLPLNAYFDDTEPDNALGSHAGDHKLGTVYYNCPVIPQKYLSLLKNIFVSAIFLSDDRDVVNGNHKVFHNLILELKSLADGGLDISIDGRVITIYFPLVVFLGDNLGLNSILGFIESFVANFPCRMCKMHIEEIRRLNNIPPHLNRTVANYAQDVAVNSMADTGVFEECVFNEISSFHVITNASVDIMHDILEGVAKYDICQILFYLIFVREYLSMESFHLRVSDFHYGPLEAGNRPPVRKITRHAIVNDSMNLSAAEMLCLVRNLSQMVGDLVPEGDRVWRFYLTLREIVDILFALNMAPGTEDYLHAIIQDHNTMYIELFHQTLKPKFHHMLHYRDILKSVGPLVLLSSIRWEAKHRFIKQVARNTCSRINLPYTLMVKIMLDFGFRVLSEDGLRPEFELGKMSVYRREFVDPNNLIEYFDVDVPHGESFNTVSWLKVNGIYFKNGMVIHVDVSEHLPVFAHIVHIIFDGVTEGHEPNVIFVCRYLSTICFSHHYHSYEVRESDEWMAVALNKLVTPHSLMMRTLPNGLKYVNAKYDL